MYRLLIVDDDAYCQDLLSDVLESEEYELYRASDGQTALEMVQQTPPDAVLLDIDMPGIDGIEVLKRLKASEETRHIPVIMVTALDAESQIADCLDNGAVDHVVKPFSNTVVRARVRAALRSYDTIQKELARALTDVLTELPNRRAFDEAIMRQCACWHRQELPFSLILFDVDRFKRLNDTYGHAVGDEVLRHLATTLKRTFRAMDFVARVGGEEFAIILPSTIGEDALAAASKALETVEATQLLYGDVRLRVTVSAGVACITKHESTDQLFQRADTALYASKNAGRNCAHIHNDQSMVMINCEVQV